MKVELDFCGVQPAPWALAPWQLPSAPSCPQPLQQHSTIPASPQRSRKFYLLPTNWKETPPSTGLRAGLLQFIRLGLTPQSTP